MVYRDNRSGGGRGGFGGGFRGRSRGFDRDSERSDRRPEMFEAECAKCGKQCRVPFRPTGNKPVLCSDCFRQSGGGRDRGFDRDRGDRGDRQSSSGVSSAQLNQINAKLDKIIKILGIDSEE